ncbi:hypothetical protein F5878DRAFT_604569 [Lentinula raphanica]|uniref:F-box domain-containing protein n=1 Tax=Lentinula raphanica TaxID=153919 RepID=A0AA38PIX5_9AGAR|nr:hypothetical protein F5878DRAFT_604569 [Lentinula raphanica]
MSLPIVNGPRRQPRRFRGAGGSPPQVAQISPPGPELIASFIAAHHKQHQSPLFYHIPPEIRNTIFLYALLSYEDLSVVYRDDKHYSRPDYHHASRIDPRLLQTCRLVYLETRYLPLNADEHVFWCHRAPPGIRHASDPKRYFERFTEDQKDRIHRVHFFTQQYYLEGSFETVCKNPDMRPESMKITIRHGDWWWWERNNPLRLKEGWSKGLEHSKRLAEVILELETMERDKDQIYAIASRVSKETLRLNNGKTLSTAGNAIVKKEWIGPSRLDDIRYNQIQKVWVKRDEVAEQDVPDPGLKYCIVVIRWTPLQG